MRLLTGWSAVCIASSLLIACTNTPQADKPVDKTIVGNAAPAAIAPCPKKPNWDDPTAPRHIQGNTWYVGTCSISAILITSDAGHILIDGVTDTAASNILANIRALGFDPKQVRYILNSHEHIDHAGGIARLARDTGARVVAREPAATALERGKGDRGDPQFLSVPGFPPVANVQRIGDGETLSLGGLQLTAHATPGHTPGGTSWSWRSCDAAGECRAVVYADSLTPFSDKVYRYSDDAAHPGALAAFRRSIDTVAALPCEILLTPHPGASAMFERIGPQASKALVDTGGCRAYAAEGATKLDTRLKEEQAQPSQAH
ncbi:subclass B3 metallo-beta-lactamase [Pseudomonas sp. CGJS7]|uniref:subclass B3 metallo-beta-lactamase n=1 Tax=Pseudomonas sp. CGJS7 TaxID=3109348 RepID=UPI0030089AEE